MGSAIAKAVAETVDPIDILLADRHPEKVQELVVTLGAHAADNDEVARECGWIFLAVKPQGMEEMLAPLQNTLAVRGDEFVLVTMAAGLSVADIARMAGGDYPIIRIMPNTPVAVLKGMTVACASTSASGGILESFRYMMRESGKLDFISEDLIDAAMALSGCGPAYVYLFLDALADGAAACGLPREKALEYACQTVIGAGTMVSATGQQPQELCDAVCSPGGTTIEGVHALKEGGMRDAVMNAVKAAYEKTAQLKKES